MQPLTAMLTIRILEEKLQKLCYDGLAGDLHFSRGQEAIAVGVCQALDPTDHVVTHHRTIAHLVARGADLRRLVAEVLGRQTGFCGGRAGEMHVRCPEIRHAFSFQLVGTCVPVAAGLAYALKHMDKSSEIVACFFGDAASSNGQVHEGLSLATTKRCPVLFVCENNHRAGNVTPEEYMPPRTPEVSDRMAGYGIRYWLASGNSEALVSVQAHKAIEYVRYHGEPAMLEVFTERLCHHKQGQGDTRSKEELAEIAKRSDPLHPSRMKDYPEFESLRKVLEANVDVAIAQALADPIAEAT